MTMSEAGMRRSVGRVQRDLAVYRLLPRRGEGRKSNSEGRIQNAEALQRQGGRVSQSRQFADNFRCGVSEFCILNSAFCISAYAQPPRPREQPLSAPAPEQPGGLVSLGCGGDRQGPSR